MIRWAVSLFQWARTSGDNSPVVHTGGGHATFNYYGEGAEEAERRHQAQMDGLGMLREDLPDATAARVMAALRRSGVIPRAEAEGLAERVVLALARRLRPEEALDLDRAVREVEHAVEIALATIRRGERGSNEDAFVDAVLAEVARRTRAGELDAAARTVEDALAELDAREAEQREAMRLSRRALLEEGLQTDILRRDPDAAVQRTEALVRLGAPGESAPWAPEFMMRWNRFFEEGRDRGLGLSLEVAIAMARRMRATATTGEERGVACNLLGFALETLGEREPDATRLREAVAAHDAALAEFVRDQRPREWAATQVGRGDALRKLGASEKDAARLADAVSAHRAASEEIARADEPLFWAEVQCALGNSLTSLGLREDGTARLEEAAEAYGAALEELTRERDPRGWAATQNNLGAVLRALGERENDASRLRQAIGAYRAALEERTRERLPLSWAKTQHNLGSALFALDSHEDGTACLEEASLAYRAALEERTRDRSPFLRAETLACLAFTEESWGDRTEDATRWRDAVDLLEEALETYRAVGATARVEWAIEMRDRLMDKLRHDARACDPEDAQPRRATGQPDRLPGPVPVPGPNGG